jgi:AcrR family transcriptional regulator
MPAGKSQPSDLNTQARIRNAALRLFAERGMAASSVRTVAKEAGVSPGLVQHHFKTKDDLQAAIETHVAGKLVELVSGSLIEDGGSTKFVLGRQIVEFIRENPDIIRYARREMLENSILGRRLFDQIVAVGRVLMERLAKLGFLRADADREWANLNAIFMTIGPVLLEAGVNRYLDKPFRSAEGLARWDAAVDDMLCRGVYSEGTPVAASPAKRGRRAAPVKRKTKR